MNDGFDWEGFVFSSTTESEEVQVRQAFTELSDSLRNDPEAEIPETLTAVLRDSRLAGVLRRFIGIAA